MPRRLCHSYGSLCTKDSHRKAWYANWHRKSSFPERASWMERHSSVEQIKAAVFSLPADKAPSRVSFTMALYQECWQTIKEDLIQFSEIPLKWESNKTYKLHIYLSNP